MMACNYMIWDREAGHTGNLKGSLQYCGADSDSSRLCPEHAAFVADCTATEVSKLDMKYWYRVPAKRKAKLAPPNVRETIIEPGHYAKQYALYEAAEGKDTYWVWFGKAILPVRAEPTAEDIAEARAPANRGPCKARGGAGRIHATPRRCGGEGNRASRCRVESCPG